MSGIIPAPIWLDTATSTNSELASRADRLPHGAVVACREQTAGRGQRGNSWEAEPGRNLTFSLLLRPSVIGAAESFRMSMLVSIAVAEALERAMPGRRVTVKWPNDIYVDDLKICGILIENSFSGRRIDHAIIGIGINVNQSVFRSDAPNPVSMTLLTGLTYDLDTLLADVTMHIVETFDSYEAAPDDETLSRRYHDRLWRRHGLHRWHGALTGEDITAALRDVALSGHLTLDTDPPRTYAFKEISAIL
ncbi:MAG: biotin--[acetyl-CoA-carboxylase] ligase [Bacteroidales bacterium]|nr:biotin--[acetyl-CoA-carboxylase] ligase [Bacteroidales bacterium]